MALRPVLILGDPRLRQKSLHVTPEMFQQESFKNLLADLQETMYVEDGVGLAAPQIGVNLQVIALDVSSKVPGERLRLLINPILNIGEGSQEMQEACLSVPGESEVVKRLAKVSIVYLDQWGTVEEIDDATGFFAVALQHEIDHLSGVLFIDHLSSLKRNLITKRIEKKYGTR